MPVTMRWMTSPGDAPTIFQLSTPPPAGTNLGVGDDGDAGRRRRNLHPLAAHLRADRHVVDEGAAAGHAIDRALSTLKHSLPGGGGGGRTW